MPSITLYNQKGVEKGQMQLSESVFGVPYNEPVIHRVVVAQHNNARQGTKSTLTRTEVRGGGIKPWRQKGTGRARQGSIRAPQWIKGGVVFAPKPRDFSQKINKREKRLAFVSALSAKLSDGNLMAIDKFEITALKTKEMVAILKALKITERVLIVTDQKDEGVVRTAANLQNVYTITADVLSVTDIVKNAKCLMTEAAIKKIEEGYADESL